MSGESLLTEFEKLKEDNLLQRSRIIELEQRLQEESELRQPDRSLQRENHHYETVIRRQDPQFMQSEGITPKRKNCDCDCHYSAEKEVQFGQNQYITVEDISPSRRQSKFEEWRRSSPAPPRAQSSLEYKEEYQPVPHDRSAQGLYHRNVKRSLAAPLDQSSYYPRYTYENIPGQEIVNGRKSWYLPYHWWVGGGRAQSRYFSSSNSGGFRRVSNYDLAQIESEVAEMKKRQRLFQDDEHFYRRKGGYYHYGFMKPLLGRSKSEGRFGKGGRYYIPEGEEAYKKEWLHFNYD